MPYPAGSLRSSSVVLFDGRIDDGRRCPHDGDVQPGVGDDVADGRVVVGAVGHGHDQRRAFPVDRDGAVLVYERCWQQGDHLARDVER